MRDPSPPRATRRLEHRSAGIGLALLATLVLAACGSVPKGPAAGRDGPPLESTLPADATAIPDAEPRIEPLRPGGPNKPYEVLGQTYRPETRDVPIREQGLASWYGRKFDGRRTASGEIYDMNAMTAAHKTMPLPSYARVRNPRNGREIVVRINDRGPFVAGRIIDLSYAAAIKLGVAGGVAPVEVERLTFEDIRTGAWRRTSPGAPFVPPEADAPSTAVAVAPASAAVAVAPASAAVAVAPASAAVAIAPASAAVAVAPASGAAAGSAVARAQEAASGAGADPPPAATAGAQGSQALPSPDERPPTVAAAAPVADAPAAAAGTAAARGFWIQLGAFRERHGVESFRQHLSSELDWLAPLLAVFREAPLYRLQAGPYPSRDEAQGAAQRVREALQLVPMIVERR